jgi:hypothetical protein
MVAGVLSGCPAQGSASVFEAVSDRQLICEATEIIRGHVTEIQSAWDSSHDAIWTTATVQVQDVLAGTLAPQTTIHLKEVGGTVDGYTIKAEGFPTFRVGEEIVALLRPWDDDPGAYRVWGYGRGLYTVSRRGAQRPAASRYDVVESGRATMAVDRIPPALLLEGLSRQLEGFRRTCGPKDQEGVQP